MGAGHGAYCVACCWALMALVSALGVMNLLCLEKIAPAGRVTGRAFGLAFVIWGAWLLAV
jgi:predicted metal-binding membrane protein